MSEQFFRITEHELEASHIRGYPRATTPTQEEVLHLSIKQYTPLDNLDPQPGDVTIIAAHGNGFAKELYEPLWDEVLSRSTAHNFRIRSIWIADLVHEGQSGVLNEHQLGNDPAWLDHSRDLLHMVNVFRCSMPRPIVGIGHSLGGCILADLAILHPRLFETLVLVDPVIQRTYTTRVNLSPAFASAFRRDRWPSREAARAAFLKSPFYQSWDPRVLDRWVTHGLRDLPTALYPSSPPEVTLKTTKHQEVMTFLRPNFPPHPSDLEPATSHAYSLSNPTALNRRTHPDLTPGETPQTPFYRAESILTFAQLPRLRPSVRYVLGGDSFLTSPATIKDKLDNTGTGVGGSGGVKEGRVDHVVVEKGSHLIPMEQVGEVAGFAAPWIGKEMRRWRELERLTEREWGGRQGVQRALLTDRFLEELSRGTGRVKKAGGAGYGSANGSANGSTEKGVLGSVDAGSKGPASKL